MNNKETLINITTEELKGHIKKTFKHKKNPKIFGVPRGGIYIAYLIEAMGLGIIVDHPQEADIIVDDLIDSGTTMGKYKSLYPNKLFYAPITKMNKKNWILFPWDKSAETSIEDNIIRIIQYIGEDPAREGLLETPKRVVKSWGELFSGYKQNPSDHLKFFKSESNEMVICKNIEYYSTCEHHMIPFYGQIHIGYIPNGYVIGLSKLARIADVFARRLQIQEMMTRQIAETIYKGIKGCYGVGVIVEGKHLCMCSRGANKQNSMMKTSCLLGDFKKNLVRQEFLSLIKNS